MEQRYTEEIEIDLLDLIYHVALKWKMILVWMILGALALGGFSFLSSYKEAEQQKNSQVEVSAGDVLENEQKEEVLTLYNQVKGAQYLIDNTQEYMSESVLMNLDVNNVESGEITYLIKTSDVTKLSAIESAYEKLLVRDNILSELTQKVNKDIKSYGLKKKLDQKYVKELISVSAGDREQNDVDGTKVHVQNNMQNNTQSILSVYVYGENQNFCEAVADTLMNHMSSVEKEIKDKVGEYRLSYITSRYSKGYSEYVYTAQNNKVSSLADNQGKVNSLVTAAGLDDNQKAYLKELLQESNSSAKQVKKQVVKTQIKPSVSKKYVLIGAVLGAFAICAYVFVFYLISGRLHTEDQVESIYGIKQLGVIIEEKKKSVDSWIYRIFKGRQRKFAYDESFHMIEAGIKVVVEKKKYQKVLLTGSYMNEKQEKFIDHMMKVLMDAGIEVMKTPCVLYDPQAMLDMATADAVVLVEELEKSLNLDIRKELEVFTRQGVDVIGTVIFE
ncbi:MAG: hypothetical protein ACOX1S_10765 [Anaerostipes sp.]|jgi:predicted nucleic acid-binding protein